jgi:hypothetical protein
MEQFKRALAINLGGHKYCAHLLESSDNFCDGIWFVDLLASRSVLSVLIKCAADRTVALYQLPLTEESIRDFVSVLYFPVLCS